MLSASGCTSNSTHRRLRWFGTPGLMSCVLAVAGACASDQSDDSVGVAEQGAAATEVLLNEVLFNPIGTATADNAHQYIELVGSAGGTLEGYAVVVVDGRAAGAGSSAGKVLAVADLGTACSSAACAIGSNGLLVITPAATGGFTFPNATTRVSLGYTMPNNTTNVDDVSILLVKSTVAITTATDFDSADNGTLTPPTGVTLVDAIGWRESTTGFVYGGVNVKPNTVAQDAPRAIVRIAGNTTASTVNAWFYADTVGNSSESTQLGNRTAAGTGTIPTGLTDLTPGLANIAANIPVTGTAGAAGAAGAVASAGTAGLANGGTAGTLATTVPSVAGAAGNAGTAGTAGQIVIPIGTGGAPPATGGAPPATGGTPPATGGANVAGASQTSQPQAGSSNVAGQANQPTGGATNVAGQANVAGVAGAVVATAGAAGKPLTGTGGATVATGGAKAVGGAAPATGGAAPAAGGAAPAAGGKTTTGGGSTAKGGATTAGGSTGTSTTEEPAADDEEGSCGCRTVGSSKAPATGMAAMLGLIGIVLSRRRRRR